MGPDFFFEDYLAKCVISLKIYISFELAMPFLVLHLKEIIVFVWQGFSCKDIPSGDARNKT